MWGGAYGVINLTNTAYAYGDGQRAGTHIGLNRAVSTLGPVLALGLGGWLVTQIGSAIMCSSSTASVGLLAVPLALLLPRLRQTVGDAPARQRALDGRARSIFCFSWSRSARMAFSPRRFRRCLPI